MNNHTYSNNAEQKSEERGPNKLKFSAQSTVDVINEFNVKLK